MEILFQLVVNMVSARKIKTGGGKNLSKCVRLLMQCKSIHIFHFSKFKFSLMDLVTQEIQKNWRLTKSFSQSIIKDSMVNWRNSKLD